MTAPKSPFVLDDFTAEDAKALAVALNVVADPVRLRILSLLTRHGPLSGKALMPLLDLTQPTVSHHLRVLREAGLIVDRAAGKETLRVLAVDANARLAALINPYAGAWAPAGSIR